jgi:hypothetical protein
MAMCMIARQRRREHLERMLIMLPDVFVLADIQMTSLRSQNNVKTNNNLLNIK